MTTEAMRAQFEAWVQNDAGWPTNRYEGGFYAFHKTNCAWAGYQAALRSPAVAGLVEAARAYFDGYCQDEAAEDGPEFTCCTVEQHEAAKRLRSALANFTGDKP